MSVQTLRQIQERDGELARARGQPGVKNQQQLQEKDAQLQRMREELNSKEQVITELRAQVQTRESANEQVHKAIHELQKVPQAALHQVSNRISELHL